MTAQLLAFGRKQILQPQVLSLGSLANGMLEMLHRLMGEDIEFSVVIGPELWSVRADPGKVEQVIMNLVVNARDAMPLGGALAISLANRRLDAEFKSHHPEALEGEFVDITVSDTGTGMSEMVLAHIFEPFFTTKAKGKGTGLGLATVYGIVKQSDGFILCQSVAAHGTTFDVFLPRCLDEPPKQAPALDAGVDGNGGTEKILLVEDDDGVRSLIVSMLSRKGYDVVAMRGGRELFAAYTEPTEEFSLLITDVIMPGMDGRMVADRVRALCPGIKVLFISGYTESSIVRRGVLDEGLHFLQKPFSSAGLLRKIRSVIDGVPGK